MSYDQALRLYGSDKPDMRLPAMVDVRAAFTPEELEKFASGFKVSPDFTSLLIRIPKAGDISGTERRTIGTYGAFAHAQGTASVSLMTDPNRFARDYPNSLGANSECRRSRAGRFVAARGAQGRLEAECASVLPNLRTAPA